MGIRLERAASTLLHLTPTLDADQRRVVAHRGGPLLVLAGPGTGKTTTLVEVVAQRIAEGTDPSRILLLTFGRKAAGEIRERLASRIAVGCAPKAWTFHGWCYSLLCELPQGRPGLVTGPEQDSIVSELLRGSLQEGTGAVDWPEELRSAVQTHTFAAQFRELISRALDQGMGPAELLEAGRAADRRDWQIGADVFQDYLDVLQSMSALDYSSLIDEVRRCAEDGRLAALAERFDLVVVDEYQDTDAAQVALLHTVTGGGRDIIAIGDPDQSIYAFRGAEVSGILGFADTFRDRAGNPAPTIELRTSGRAGAVLLAASRRIAQPLQYAGSGLNRDALARHRDLTPRPDLPDGELEVVALSGELAQARWIAEQLRLEHLERDTPWSDMAILVRSVATAAPIRRALLSYGVPVEIAADEFPLVEHPIVKSLLSALGAVSARGVDGAFKRIGDAQLIELLTSAMVRAEPTQMRTLGRHLRRAERVAHPERSPRSAEQLVAEAVRDRTLLDRLDPGLRDTLGEPVTRLGDLVAEARTLLESAGGPLEALWLLWSRSSWYSDLRPAALGHGYDAVAANLGLDAVIALFSAVSDILERRPRAQADYIVQRLETLQIPGDVRAEAAVRGDAVRLLTAHRSKGLEWPVVVVAGVQDGTWPDVRARGSMLEADRLHSEGLAPAASRGELIAEERRLFYVAVTRAKRRLIVTAVDGGEGAEQPSSFVTELSGDVPLRLDPSQRRRATRLVDVVADLRRVLVESEIEADRDSAAQTLAWLATQRDHEGRALCSAADPTGWWGSVSESVSPVPVRAPDRALKLSGSTLATITQCPQRWAFEHEVRAGAASASAAMFGGVVHAIVEELANGDLDPEDIDARLDSVWSSMTYSAAWESDLEREAAHLAIRRFLEWQSSRTTTVEGSEVGFDLTVQTANGPVRLTGAIDRIERDDDGRLRVFDFKTTRHAPTKLEAQQHPQMGVYQLAIREGAFGESQPAGAGLVHLRLPHGSKDPYLPKVLMQDPLGAHGLVDDQLAEAAEVVRQEAFAAKPGEHCGYCAFQTSCASHDFGTRVVP